MNTTVLRREWLSNVRGDILAGAVVALALIPEVIAFSIIDHFQKSDRIEIALNSQMEREAIEEIEFYKSESGQGMIDQSTG